MCVCDVCVCVCARTSACMCMKCLSVCAHVCERQRDVEGEEREIRHLMH